MAQPSLDLIFSGFCTLAYKAKSVSLRYLQNEDRIQWVCHCADKRLVSAWVTRRILSILLPRVAKWLDENNQGQSGRLVKKGSLLEQKQIALFEHEAAKEQVGVVRESAAMPKMTAQFLMEGLEAKAVKGGAKVVLFSKQKKVVVEFTASFPELHKLMGELVMIAERARWGVHDPWGSGRAPKEKHQISMH